MTVWAVTIWMLTNDASRLGIHGNPMHFLGGIQLLTLALLAST